MHICVCQTFIFCKTSTYIYIFLVLVCPNGTEYRGCGWNLSCSDITGVRGCKEQSPCTSGCFCSDGTILQDGVCADMNSCSGSWNPQRSV